LSGHLHAPVALPAGKEPPIPIGQEAGWAPETVWTLEKRKKCLALARNQTPAVQLVALRYTDLVSRLSVIIIIIIAIIVTAVLLNCSSLQYPISHMQERLYRGRHSV
jgi:hypothetical protein